MENESTFIMYGKADCNELKVILWTHYEIKNEVSE